ncbi:MAG: hypothetical protein KKF65_06055, partial [Nanoarchaeota archaeon]|nr:hypothetical protein [Nanoarchaeota archaeon]
ISLLKEKPIDEELVKNRDRHNVVISDNGEISVLVGAEADKFQERYVSKFYSYKNEFKGRVASKGYAKGKAKIVLKDTDFSKLKQGDILVVISTGPDYVPIMKKSAAIIAEEGSITSHVSVISREFRIPCIVGVDYITNILKDGDLVEVDADKGIIRKIK